MKLRLLAIAFFCTALIAQEGHPMKGTWHGTFGPADSKERTTVTLVMDWDGKNVTGIMNPGLRSSPIEKAALDSDKWTFHFEANLKERSGAVSRISVDAKLVEITSPRRQLVGTWTQGTQKSEFKATRDN
jgi:hypothetical protein